MVQHKKVLFEELEQQKELEKAPQKKETKILIYNGLMAILSFLWKFLATVIVCLLGSFALTVVFTALMQDRAALEVATEIINKLIALI
ncbi:MAG: hypothetical protein RSB38_00250 [Oscillospiraceae bacterium]